MLDKRLNDKGKNWRHVFKVCLRQQRMSPLVPRTIDLWTFSSRLSQFLTTSFTPDQKTSSSTLKTTCTSSSANSSCFAIAQLDGMLTRLGTRKDAEGVCLR